MLWSPWHELCLRYAGDERAVVSGAAGKSRDDVVDIKSEWMIKAAGRARSRMCGAICHVGRGRLLCPVTHGERHRRRDTLGSGEMNVVAKFRGLSRLKSDTWIIWGERIRDRVINCLCRSGCCSRDREQTNYKNH